MPWSISQVFAFVAVHAKVADSPARIVSGKAVIATVGGGTTVTVTLAVVVPPNPVAVMVYVVVIAGVTATEPLTSTVPTPWSISQVSAVVVVHVSVADSPAGIISGEAVNVTVGGGTTVTVTLPSSIAFTGTNAGNLIALSLALLALGAALVFLSRRRRMVTVIVTID